jgi:hypothetical protein
MEGKYDLADFLFLGKTAVLEAALVATIVVDIEFLNRGETTWSSSRMKRGV